MRDLDIGLIVLYIRITFFVDTRSDHSSKSTQSKLHETDLDKSGNSVNPPMLERIDVDSLTQKIIALRAEGVPKPVTGPPFSDELGPVVDMFLTFNSSGPP